MKNIILAGLVVFSSITTMLSGYEPFNARQWSDNYIRNFNDQYDRTEQRMQAQESNRIQRDMLNQMQRNNRPGFWSR
jgi:hypothetical protein